MSAEFEAGELGTLDELKQALVENLEHRGVLGKLKAQVRSEVFHTLDSSQENVLHPPISNDTLLINELVREYLNYNGYRHALSVFMSESGQPNDRALDREFLRDELGLTEQRESILDRKLPLLYGITHALRRWKEGSFTASSVDGKHDMPECAGRGQEPPRVSVRKEDAFMLNNHDESSTSDPAGARPTHRDDNNGVQDPTPLLFTKNTER